MIEALTWALALDPATLKWPAAVLLALGFGLVLFGLVQYQAFNRLWGIQLVLGLAGGAVVAGLGAAVHWLLGVLYGVGYVLTWLVWVLTRRWSGWRRALARGLTPAVVLGPWLWLGATEKAMLRGSRPVFRPALSMVDWLMAPSAVIWFWMLLGVLWLLVLVGGWGCWSWPEPAPPSAPAAGEARPLRRRRWLVVTWAMLGVLGLIWYFAGRVDLTAAGKEGQSWRLGFVLVSRPGSQGYRDLAGWTPLHWTAYDGQVAALPVLLAAGADAHAKDNEGKTPLHLAAWNGPAEALRVLLAAGADVNAKDDRGGTALHWAAQEGKLDALRILLAAGADVNAKDNDDWTPLHSAARIGDNAEALRLLLAAGATIHAKDNDGATPLHRSALAAFRDRDAKPIHVLLAAGADINARTNGGGTPLHYAAVNDYAEALRILLAAGADVNARDAKGKTALDAAKNDECRTLLRQAGGNSGEELDAEQARRR